MGDRTITSLSEGERDRWRRNTVGLVFQDFQLVEDLSVLENILLPARFDHCERRARCLSEPSCSRIGSAWIIAPGA